MAPSRNFFMSSRFANVRAEDPRLFPLETEILTYLQSLEQINIHTARARRYDLIYFLEHCEKQHPNCLLGDVARVDVAGFKIDRLKREAPSTVDRRLANIRTFWRAMAFKWTIPNPCEGIKMSRLNQPFPRGMEEAEEEKLIEVARDLSSRSFDDLRNYTILRTFLETGLRLFEVRSLTPEHISSDGECFQNVLCKGLIYREVAIGDELLEDLRNYLPQREDRFASHFHKKRSLGRHFDLFPLFPSFRSADCNQPESFRTSEKTIWRIVTTLCREAGIRHHSPHRMRHTLAHNLLRSSRDIRLVAQQLGHKSLETTMRYTQRDVRDLKNAINAKNKKGKQWMQQENQTEAPLKLSLLR